MRRALLTIIFGMILLPVVAREYYPMLKNGKEWYYYLSNSVSREYDFFYRLDGDTIIDGEKGYKVWSKFLNQQTGEVHWDYSLVGTMTEKDGRTYFIEHNGRRQLICDLNMKVGEVTPDGTRRIVAVDSIYVMGRTLKRLEIEVEYMGGWEPGGYWAESIGGSSRCPDYASPTQLVTCYEDDRCIFADVEFTYMPAVRTEPAAIPLLEDGKVWWYEDYSGYYFWPEDVFRMFIDGDTIANGKTWKKLYHNHTAGAVPVFAKALREDGGRVYKLEEDGSETLAFDFTLNIGDRYAPENGDGRYMEVIAVDTMLSEGMAHRRLILQQYVGGIATDLTCWVEGIGSDYGIDLTAFWSVSDWKVAKKREEDVYNYCFFECVNANGQCVYSNKWKSYYEPQSVMPVQFKDSATNTCYDLHGRRVQSKPAKGVYIRGGRKVVVK